MKSNVLLIINPYAGKGNGAQLLQAIIDSFIAQKVLPLVFLTQPDVKKTYGIISEYAEKIETIVCVGGDGTLNDVITGLMQLSEKVRPVLGYIPMGTTNDFARTLELTSDIKTAIPQILEHNIQKLDMGKFNGHNFAYIASFGTFTSSSYETPQALKNSLGHLAYVLSGAKELAAIEEYFIKVRMDTKEISGSYVFCSVTNATSIGGLVSIDRELVNLQDGLFEVILVKFPKNLMELKQLIEALRQEKFENSDLISIYQANRLEFMISEPIAWSLDGEKSETGTEFTIENIPRALKICMTHDKKTTTRLLRESNE